MGETRSPVVVTAKSTTSSTIPAGVASSGKSEATGNITTYPDGTNTNRRPPFVKKGCYEIPTKYDPRIFDTCGELLCTSGSLTRVWSIMDGELLMSLAHTEGIKATSISFKPGATPKDEGKYIWIGMNSGELMEVELSTQRLICSKPHIHGRFEVTNIYRHYNALWTLDESGSLLVWGPGEDGVPNVSGSPTQTFKVPKQHSFAMVVGDELWHATGKEMRVFLPTLDGRSQFQVLIRPLVADGAGDITSGATIKSHPGKVFLGHSDGKVSMYSTNDYTCLGVISVSTWKINALAGVGSNLWAAFNLGKICVYDVDQNPWVVLKEWQAHDNPVVKMKADKSSAYQMDRLHVLSLGADNKVRVWDGLLQDDWLEEEMKARDTQYCEFDEIRALVMTWNAGASTPHSLRYAGDDSKFFQHLIQTSDSPDILIFGFQELVDLEDKRATAKRLFKTSKKKEGPDQEHMSHQYRDWRDFLMKSLDDYMPADDLYHLLHTAPLVGLFTCVFVKASLRERIRNLSAAEIKRGMGGLHGNKGAVAVRFQVDDTSLCFVNCHLAAGQTQANARHNDIAAILETNVFPPERDLDIRLDTYCGGGDGTLIVDHELCILNGDLNYRIDTMSRDTVVMAVKQNNLAKLLERDQLLVARRRNPAFRLRAFEELPITFAPTYKYDVGTDTYDTSEKRRSPAWCDRMLFRGRGRIQQLDYLRHEVRVSDHRPVSGSFRMWVKRVDPRGRATCWMQCQQGFENIRQREMADEK
jgi:WD40 repeat protein